MNKYDYIILGAGASGLMLAYRLANDSFFDDKSILIIDKVKDKGNDRTWCYWEDDIGEWDDILEKTWPTIYFGSPKYSKTIDISPYSYKMLRSKKFYNKLWRVISKKSNITFLEAEVKDFTTQKDEVLVTTNTDKFRCSKLFNSLQKSNFYKSQKKYPVIQQHFLGWFVETEADTFDDSFATFMDFNVAQNGNTRFMYVLPISKRKALFEYTLFSKDLLKRKDYEDAIEDYLNKSGITAYKITEKEMGSIPMTSFKFSKLNTKHILNIGTAGGWTKASTGYTFRNTTKNTKALIEFLKGNDDLSKFYKRSKFWWYDLLFLDVLANHNEEGSVLFASMFKNGSVKTILRFLDEESTLLEDLKIIFSVPPKRFLQYLLKRIFKV